jgi:membrane-associated HD superfamily phosphohydrolase
VYEFGVTLTLAALVGWTPYDSRAWSSTSVEWIEVTYETVTFTEVIYETTIIEESYETYSEEYSESYGVDLEETVTTYEETETSFEESMQVEEAMDDDSSDQEDSMKSSSSENDEADEEDEEDEQDDSSAEETDEPDHATLSAQAA